MCLVLCISGLFQVRSRVVSRIFIRSEERWTQKEDKGEGSKTRVKKVEKNKRRREWKKAERRERERGEDFHFCLHLAAIVDSVTSLGGSVAAIDQHCHLENPVRTLQ